MILIDLSALNQQHEPSPRCVVCNAAGAELVGDDFYCDTHADEPQDCRSCSATGEGGADGYNCGACHGRGYHESPRLATMERPERDSY